MSIGVGTILTMGVVAFSGGMVSMLLNTIGKSNYAQILDIITVGTLITTAVAIVVEAFSVLGKLF